MQIELYKTQNKKFLPAYEDDKDKADKLKIGDVHTFTVKKIRNPKLHRLYFRLIKMAFENQETYNSFDLFRKVMQMKAGYFKVVEGNEGPIPVPDSIAYEHMDEIAFRELFDRVLDVLAKEMMLDREILLQEIK